MMTEITAMAMNKAETRLPESLNSVPFLRKLMKMKWLLTKPSIAIIVVIGVGS